MASTAVVDALKDLCSRIEIVTSPKSRPVSRGIHNADHVSSTLRAEAGELIARLGLVPDLQPPLRHRLAVSSLGNVSHNSTQVQLLSKKTGEEPKLTTNNSTIHDHENHNSRGLLNEDRPVIKRSTALVIARDVLLNSAVDSMQSQTKYDENPTFVVPKKEIKKGLIRPRTNTPLPAASFLELQYEAERLITTPRLLPFEQRPVSNLSQSWVINERERSEQTKTGIFDKSEEERFNKREFQRRRYSLPTALTSFFVSDGVVKSSEQRVGTAQSTNVLLHPLDVANAMAHGSGARATALPPRPPQTRQRSNSDTVGHAPTLTFTKSRLGEWIKSQKTEKDRSEAGWAAATRLCALHTKRRVFSRFFIILQKKVRCRLFAKKVSWSLIAKSFSTWKSVIVYKKWLTSLDERAHQQSALRSLFQWRNAVIQRAEERSKLSLYSHALQCFKSSAALSKWKDHVCHRRGAKKLHTVAEKIRKMSFFNAWRVHSTMCARRNAAGLAFNKMRIRALVLPRLFNLWRRVINERRRIKCAGEAMAKLVKRRVFRNVLSKIILRHSLIEKFQQVRGRCHRIKRALRKWQDAAQDRKRIANTIVMIQKLDIRACMRTLIYRWKINAATTRSLSIKSERVKSLNEYLHMSRTVTLWKENVHELRKSRYQNHQALVFQNRTVQNRIFAIWKYRAKARIEKRTRAEDASSNMLNFKVLRALFWWRYERNKRVQNVAVSAMIEKCKIKSLQSCFRAWVDQWANEKEMGHNLELLAVLYHRAHRQKIGIEAFKRKSSFSRHLRLQWNRAVVHHGFSVVSRSFRAIRDYSVRSRTLQRASLALSALAPCLHIASSFFLWKMKAQHTAKTKRKLRQVLISARTRFLVTGLRGLRMACKDEEMLDQQIAAATRFRKSRIMKVWAHVASIRSNIRRQYEIAVVFSNRRKARKALLIWVKKTSTSSHARTRSDLAASHFVRRSFSLAVNRWKRNTHLKTNRTAKNALAYHYRFVRLLRPFFNQWKEQYTSSTLIRAAVDEKAVRALYKRCFEAWKFFARMDRIRKQMFATSLSSIIDRAFLRKTFSLWIRGAWFSKIEMLRRRQVQEDVFRKIQRYGRIRSARKRQSEYLSVALTSGDPRILCWARMVAVHFQSIHGVANEALESAIVHQKMFRCFNAWKTFAKMERLRRIKREASDTAAREYIIYCGALKGLMRWRAKTRELTVKRLGSEMAISFHDSHLLHHAMKSWKEHTIANAASVRIAQRNLLKGKLCRSFRAWAGHSIKMKKESSLLPLRNSFNNWLRNSRAQRLLRMWREAEHRNTQQRTSVFPQRSIGASEAVRLAFAEWTEDKETVIKEKLSQMPRQSHLEYQEL